MEHFRIRPARPANLDESFDPAVRESRRPEGRSLYVSSYGIRRTLRDRGSTETASAPMMVDKELP